MLTDHIHEDSAARAQRDAADSRHLMMKCALAQPINVPAGFTDPIQLIAKARASMKADRARAGVVLPFQKKAAPTPSRPLPPALPLRPAAKLAQSVTRKLAAAPDTKHSNGLGDLLRAKIRLGGAR